MSHVIVLSPAICPITHKPIGYKLQLYFMESDSVVASVPELNVILHKNHLKTVLCGNALQRGIIASLIDTMSQYSIKSSNRTYLTEVLNEAYANILFGRTMQTKCH